MKRAVPWIRVAGFIVGLVVLVAIFDMRLHRQDM